MLTNNEKQEWNTDEWVSVKERLPEVGVEVIAFNPEWLDEDYNLHGMRVGFLNESQEDGYFVSAKYNNYQDCYETDGDPDSSKRLPDEIFTYWRPFPSLPNSQLK